MTNPSTANGRFPSVVVTSLAATTSLAGDVDATWKGLLNGDSGIATLEDDFVAEYDLPVRIGGHLAVNPQSLLSRVEIRRLSYVEQLATVLGREVWKNAGTPDVDPLRLGVSIGTGLGGGDSLIDANDKMKAGGYRKVSPLAVQMVMPNGPAAVVGLELKAQAGVITPVSACSSGSEAIAHAWRMIVMGDADMVVTGGVEGYIDAVPIASFSMMRAMSTNNDNPKGASRPFDKDRDGFVFGEAGALMVIETEEHAKARGATIHARLLGAGITSDGFHLVAPDPEGTGAARAMKRAIETAGLQKSDITHVNAHATATPIGDTAEALAINKAVGNHAAVYAPKSALGHSIGAVGALESVLTVLAVREGIIPPTLNLENQDPQIDLDVVKGEPRVGQIDYAINNSFGFGGHNVALAFGKA
ncbi:KasA/KasB family beta-ketoacyl-ACP synthase [Rhodococcus sp. IEGM 1401]|jgi:beta-ketoacyl ACP synthase|uniref:KasA/KasB family beta-ketoacyl-ACP synthase n=2 Tax=Rhodococcus TaxID=1827 RepID=A0ABU4AZT1_9NOCA|nr:MULTISPECIES: KasA/KasB family beta-ketoacyl-ACP synthase [Rhodococcus]KAA0925828.1 beta-ketoacyl-ACP synthase [Rhodococcus sp. ANT_H53B]KZF01257.1 beta-ketoacyl-[acyl-carrier-protein] synthase II [Rhodococcus sp. EPR-147]KZF02646.1 beta-ketoacyl-[acyl-carrier-protein] synthase II [Rhodococcus sp. EPR-279]MCZ4559876.1 KasA/KasB family beta-ketoacyl-ACP synthase [Rhodococcus sp. IEGM 1401]MDI6627355.1 KasA/KasB family beta-ketoacyl-ACP synthase [Rhodococcus sp. (in: high G+C Gram-positive ba